MVGGVVNPVKYVSDLAKPLLELYGYKKVSVVADKLASKVKVVAFSDDRQLGAAGQKLEFDERIFWSKNSSDLVGITLHELSHKLHLGQNHYVTSNAFSHYFDFLERLDKYKSTYASLVDLKESKEFVEELEKSCSRKNFLDSVKELRKVHGVGKGLNLILEYNGSHANIPYRDVGMALANLATIVEVQKKRPGIGLFLIRDISRGVPIEVSLRKIFRGDYEKRRKSLLAKHVVLREGVLGRWYYSQGYHLGVKRRAAQFKRRNPLEAKRYSQMLKVKR